MERTAIPAAIRRQVLCESGHRCAIPRCLYPDVEIHHIIPWETCQSHDFENLIALCANCHRRADSGEIDRKSLRMYKSRLSAAIGVSQGMSPSTQLPAGKLTEVQTGRPGYEFQFEYPVFENPLLQPVTAELEGWGNGLLQKHRRAHSLSEPFESQFLGGPNTTEGAFEVVRDDSTVLSLKYRLIWYGSGSAHANGHSETRTYLKNPLYRIYLEDLFVPGSKYPELLSRLSREVLLRDGQRSQEWVNRGTEADANNFKSFNVTDSGLLLTFDEYQVDCYAVGPQVVEIPYIQLEPLLNVRLPKLWWPTA
jgi:uncharacterized protein DUF3298/HNH endonuclease